VNASAARVSWPLRSPHLAERDQQLGELPRVALLEQSERGRGALVMRRGFGEGEQVAGALGGAPRVFDGFRGAGGLGADVKMARDLGGVRPDVLKPLAESAVQCDPARARERARQDVALERMDEAVPLAHHATRELDAAQRAQELPVPRFALSHGFYLLVVGGDRSRHRGGGELVADEAGGGEHLAHVRRQRGELLLDHFAHIVRQLAGDALGGHRERGAAGARHEPAALEQVVEEADDEQWLPGRALEDGGGEVGRRRRLAEPLAQHRVDVGGGERPEHELVAEALLQEALAIARRRCSATMASTGRYVPMTRSRAGPRRCASSESSSSVEGSLQCRSSSTSTRTVSALNASSASAISRSMRSRVASTAPLSPGGSRPASDRSQLGAWRRSPSRTASAAGPRTSRASASSTGR
jgi:hypothetical protein